jgi:hypothetical protein
MPVRTLSLRTRGHDNLGLETAAPASRHARIKLFDHAHRLVGLSAADRFIAILVALQIAAGDGLHRDAVGAHMTETSRMFSF